jgi:antirestriction protein ArdC
MWTSTPAGCLIGDNCNSDVGGEPDALKGASPVRRGAEGRSLRDATRPTLRLPADYYPSRVALVAPGDVLPDRADRFVRALPASVQVCGDRAFYDRVADSITMPPIELFTTKAYWASTLAHEAGHWTGHPDRLDREFGKKFGDDAYAFEELCAEMTAALLGADLGLPTAHLDDHASYIASWLRVLKRDSRAVMTAAAKAEAAAGYLLRATGLADAPDRDETVREAA